MGAALEVLACDDAVDQAGAQGGLRVEVVAGCDLGALSLSNQTNAGIGWTVPARIGDTDGELDVALVDAVAMSPEADDACQGAAFVVYLVAGP